MRVLLDECVDRRLARDIIGHEVTTVPEAGWAAAKNGDLLALAEKKFDVLVSVDRNLSFQQSLPSFGIAVVVLRSRSNRLVDLRRLVPKLLEVLPLAVRGKATWIDA